MKQVPELIKARLWTQHGQDSRSVNEFLIAEQQAIAEPLFYLEPALQLNADGSAGRLKDFSPLTTRIPEAEIALESAYIFGSSQDKPIGIQIIANGSGCRWFKFSEDSQQISECREISKRSYEVLTRRDFMRFFGHSNYQAKLSSKLIVTEYWHDTGLLSWWLRKGEA